MSRLDNSVRNIKFGTIGLALSFISSFIARKVFVVFLSVEYLGLSGLFTNILSMLSLAELGVGLAISYNLYKPLAFKETQQIQALIKLYRNAYLFIGSFILTVGLALTPFLHFLMKETPDIPNLYLIYWLYLINSASSYFLGYKRTVLIADQKKYIDSIYIFGFQILKHLVQILVLILTRSFILFLGVMFFITISENMAISIKVNSLYPYLKGKTDASLSRDEKKEIQKNVFALSFHRVGSVLVNGTDNILLVKFVSLASAGLYANYTMIRVSINKIIGIIYSSITASIGNLSAENKAAGSKPVFDQLNFISAWVYGFTTLCLFFLYNPIISLWLGDKYLFPQSIVFVITLNYYLQGMRNPVLTFKNSLGLFWYDRYKPLFESAINLLASIILVRRFGVVGVLIGTSISTLTTCFWIEPYVVFRFGFGMPLFQYFSKYLKYTLVTILAGLATFGCLTFVTFLNPFINLLAAMLICATVPNIVYLLFFHRLQEFKETLIVLKRILHGRKNPLQK